MFSIETSKTYNAMEQFSEEGRQILGLERQIEEVADELKSMSGMENVIDALYRICDRSMRKAVTLDMMNAAGLEIVYRYRNAEQQIIANYERRPLDFRLHNVSVRNFSVKEVEWHQKAAAVVEREWKIGPAARREHGSGGLGVEMSAVVDLISILG